MSSSKDNNIYKKTSFLTGVNSSFIEKFYSDYLSDPNSLPESWKKFFDGLSDDEKLIYEDLKGPSWSRDKKIKKLLSVNDKKQNTEKDQSNLNFESIKDAGVMSKAGFKISV